MAAAEGTGDCALVVCKREFPVERKLLAERCGYFRALFEGGFLEQTGERVLIRGIHPGDEEAFEIFLQFLLEKPVYFTKCGGFLLPNALHIADMFCDDSFAVFVRRHLLDEWFNFANVDLLLEVGARLEIRKPLLWKIFWNAKQLFRSAGCDLLGSRQVTTTDLCEGVLERPAFLMGILAQEEAQCFPFEEFQDARKMFAVGFLSWATKRRQCRRSQVRRIVRLVSVVYMHEECLRDVLRISIGSITIRQLFREEFEVAVRCLRNGIRKTKLKLIIGRLSLGNPFNNFQFQLSTDNLPPERTKAHRLNLEAWKWDDLAITAGICIAYTPTTRGGFFLEMVDHGNDRGDGAIVIRKAEDGSCLSSEEKFSRHTYFGNNVMCLLTEFRLWHEFQLSIYTAPAFFKK